MTTDDALDLCVCGDPAGDWPCQDEAHCSHDGTCRMPADVCANAGECLIPNQPDKDDA